MKFVHLPHCTFYLFIQFFSTRSVVHFLSLTRSFVNEHHEYILPHPTCRRFSFVFSFISFSFCSAYFIVSFALFYIFIVILFAFPSLSFCLVLSLHFCIFIFISPPIFLLLRVCSSNWKWFVADRELELRELRKVVLMSQEENMTLNKDMEELKVFISSL